VSVTRTSRLDFGSVPDPDPAFQWEMKGKLFSLAEVRALQCRSSSSWYPLQVNCELFCFYDSSHVLVLWCLCIHFPSSLVILRSWYFDHSGFKHRRLSCGSWTPHFSMTIVSFWFVCNLLYLYTGACFHYSHLMEWIRCAKIHQILLSHRWVFCHHYLLLWEV